MPPRTKELDLDQVVEVEAPMSQLPFPLPPVETVIKQAAINVMKGTNPQGGAVILLQFITPVMVYSIQLDENAARALSEEMYPSAILKASLADLPPGIRAA